MASKSDRKANGCIFQWRIENISHCWWLKKTEVIESPTFIAEALESTKWELWLCPVGFRYENYVELYLYRKFGGGPTVIDVGYQLAFLDKDGSILKEVTMLKRGFKNGENLGFRKFETREKVFDIEKESFLPEDTLTVQCTIWNEEKPDRPKLLSARTTFKENRRSLKWSIDKYSSLENGVRNKFKDRLIDFDLVLSEEQDFVKRLTLNINAFDKSVRYISFKTSILDSEEGKQDFGTLEYLSDDLKKDGFSKKLFAKKSTGQKIRHLPKDVCTLNCECVLGTQTASYECFRSGISPESTNAVVETRDEYSVGESEMVKDFNSMFNDGTLSDTELRTSTKTFPAHRTILSARSHVFRGMFSNDMKEKNCGYVDIPDFEDDTVKRMLTYIYTDTVVDLQLESALKLYAIADKYEILSLRSRCSSFLKENLNPTNACEVLVLSDLHHDDHLKSVVQNYILGKHKEFFCSQVWKDFMSSHNELAQDIMYKKICRE